MDPEPDAASKLMRFSAVCGLGAAIALCPFAFMQWAPALVMAICAAVGGLALGVWSLLDRRVWAWLADSWRRIVRLWGGLPRNM